MADKDAPKDEITDESNVSVEPEQPELEEDKASEADAAVDDTDSEDKEVTDDADDSHDADDAEADDEPKGPNRFQKLWKQYLAKKKLTIPATVAVLIVLLLALPFTRYPILGTVIKRNLQITVSDKTTNIPISGVEVTLGGKIAKTDGEGKATLPAVKVGRAQLKVSKKYYKDFAQIMTVPLGTPKDAVQVKLEATGRQVPLHIVHKISGANLAGATVKALDTEAQTDKNGEATIVLPADQTSVEAKVSLKGFNEQTVKITVNQAAVKENTFALTPSGKVYFLSKKSGKIDVVKTDLDGTNRQTVMAGTGSEEDTNTVLLASRDWKYLALLSRREGTKARLYLIETATDALTEMDSGNATFELVGWQDHRFVYKVQRENVLDWQAKKSALKTYNAENKQLATLDETNAEGSGYSDYAEEFLGNVYILNDKLIYTKHWYGSYYSVYRLAGKRMGIYSVKQGATNKQVVKDFDAGNNTYINAVLSKPDELYFSVNAGTTTYYEYEEGNLKETKDINGDSFNKFYPTYLLSPSGQSTFWYEPRDGKNSLFIGTSEGKNGKEVASLSEYTPYGWYSDDYLLVSKSSSELYILPASGPGDKGQVLKVTDYHKPAVTYLGYGGGYGGGF